MENSLRFKSIFSDKFIFGNYDDQSIIDQFIESVDLVTYEFENIPKETLELINDNKLRPGIKSLEQTQDRLIERNVTPDLLTDQTSAHDPLVGYIPHK